MGFLSPLPLLGYSGDESGGPSAAQGFRSALPPGIFGGGEDATPGGDGGFRSALPPGIFGGLVPDTPPVGDEGGFLSPLYMLGVSNGSDLVQADGGGESKRPPARRGLEEHPNRRLALKEDDEFVLALGEHIYHRKI